MMSAWEIARFIFKDLFGENNQKYKLRFVIALLKNKPKIKIVYVLY